MQMKTAIMTFHRALNYGALLQAFALEKVLEDSGVNAEIIDYRCPHMECIYRPFDTRHCRGISAKLKKCISSLWLIKKRREFNKFTDEYLDLSSVCRNKRDLKKCVSEYSRVITGSDQVFNPDAAGGDLSYFLDFVPKGIKKIAYGASLGYGTFPEKYREECIGLLQSFDALSLREKSACTEVEKLTGMPVCNVLDPTLLLSREEWLDTGKKPGKLPDKYILVYMMEGCRYVIEKARAMANSKGYGLVLINPTLKQRKDCSDFVMYGAASPREFVGMFAEAEAVVTNSFHGVIFSLIFGKEFYAEASNTEKSARIKDLLALFDLSDRLLPYSESKKIDWKKINEILKAEREKSVLWLEDSLKI